MVVLICARRKAVETASCSCFASAFSLHKTNFCLFQRGRFQATRRNTTDIPTACTKTKWLFRCNLIFLFVQGAKQWKQRRAVVLFLLFHCTKQTFASFNVDVFRQQGETQLTFQLLALKQKWLFRCNLIFLFVQGAKRWKQRRAVVLLLLFHCTKQTFVFLTWTFSDNKAKMSNLLILQHFFTLFALFNKQWYNYL